MVPRVSAAVLAAVVAVGAAADKPTAISDDRFMTVVSQAELVVIAEVTDTALTQTPGGVREVIQYTQPQPLCGRPPQKTVVSMATRADKPIFAKGDKVIIAVSAKDVSVVEHSKEAQPLVTEALFPGWGHEKGLHCPWCRVVAASPASASAPATTTSPATCSACRKVPVAGSDRLCHACAIANMHCQSCDRTSLPATEGAFLGIGQRDPAERGQRHVADVRSIDRTRPGGQLVLYVWADLGPRVSAKELLCPHPQNLAECQTIVLLVEDAQGQTRPFFLPAPPKKLSPLTNQNTVDQTFSWRMSIPNDQPALQEPGDYTIRAVAGRLVSGTTKMSVRDVR